MKIKLNSDHDLPLNKPLKFHAITIIIRSVFEGGKLYPHVFQTTLCMNYNIKMLQYEMDVSEGIDTNKTSASK